MNPYRARRHASGHVRDFADGGRADHYRGGPQVETPLTDTQIDTNRYGRAMTRAAKAYFDAKNLADWPLEERDRRMCDFIEDYRRTHWPQA